MTAECGGSLILGNTLNHVFNSELRLSQTNYALNTLFTQSPYFIQL
jgi:hypothetical protein